MRTDDDRIESPRGGVDAEEFSVTAASDPERFRHLVEHIQDAVVEFELVDGEPVVVDINPAFAAVFGYGAEEILGESLNDFIVPPWLTEEAAALDTRTTAGKVNYSHVRRETKHGVREFLYRGIPYELDGGGVCGFAVYTDLTEDHRNESRLAVMNRLLRHNLRNKVNVIAGVSEQLVAELDGESEAAEMVATVGAAAERLEKLTDEAEAIHRTLAGPVADEPRIDCVAVVDRVVERFRARYPAASIAASAPDRCDVAATDHLDAALSSLVENAVEHNPADRPRVRVSVRSVPESKWVEVAVDDDGPRIPETERAVVTGTAEITQVRHGSGLGLWLVKWAVERFGGDLSFGRSDMGGNRVRVRLLRRPTERGPTDTDS